MPGSWVCLTLLLLTVSRAAGANGGPAVTTEPAVVAGAATTLYGVLDPGDSVASAWFEWGVTTNYGNATSRQSFTSPPFNYPFSSVITGLTARTWHYRAAASNSAGVVFGADRSFVPPVFYIVNSNLPGVRASKLAWGDYDGDHRLDLFLTGLTNNTTTSGVAQVWRNSAEGFSNIQAALPKQAFAAASWGDYDNDGRLDLLLSDSIVAQVWRNTGTGFASVVTNLGPLSDTTISFSRWGDDNRDGNLDALLFGRQVQNSSGAGFSPSVLLPSGSFADVADVNGDGRADWLLTGQTNYLWLRTARGFSPTNAGLPVLDRSRIQSLTWGDFNNDGLPDILLFGLKGTNWVTEIWRNTGEGQFVDAGMGLPGNSSFASWVDYDNDGWLDVFLGRTTNTLSTSFVSELWRNTGAGFALVPGALSLASDIAEFAWGDYNGDGRIDLVSESFTSPPRTLLWQNNTPEPNTPPSAPTGLAVSNAGSSIRFSWNAPADAQTPASALTYNLRVGSTPGGSEIVHPMSAGNGWRQVVEPGNAWHNRFAVLSIPFNQPIYWSVQAVDHGFQGGPFAPEQVATVSVIPEAWTGNFVPGDSNGDGVVNNLEVVTVLSNYWKQVAELRMVEPLGLGGTNVTFKLTNAPASPLTVEFTTNFVDWMPLGPATTRYRFTDTNAPAEALRFYRLHLP